MLHSQFLHFLSEKCLVFDVGRSVPAAGGQSDAVPTGSMGPPLWHRHPWKVAAHALELGSPLGQHAYFTLTCIWTPQNQLKYLPKCFSKTWKVTTHTEDCLSRARQCNERHSENSAFKAERLVCVGDLPGTKQHFQLISREEKEKGKKKEKQKKFNQIGNVE